MTTTRWRSRSASACITRLRGSERQSQGERGAVAGTGALGQQGAAQGLGGERTAVQSETVALGAGGEAVAEDALAGLDQAAAPGVALLHGDDFLDVLDVATKRRELLDRRIALGGQISRQLLQVLRQVFALGTRQKPRQIGGVCLQQRAHLSEPGAL